MYDDCIRYIRAAARMVAYDNGYGKEFSLRTIHRWSDNTTKYIYMGVKSNNIGTSSNKGSIGDTDKLDKDYPGYLHKLFPRALKVKGYNASFVEITHQMNRSSSVSSESRPTIELTQRQVNGWFR